MRLTAAQVETDALVLGLLEADHEWATWRDERTRRRTGVLPAFVAAHLPTGLTLAIYVRPGPVRAAHLPRTDQLPDTWHPVLWHPALRAEIRPWLASPTPDDIPGALDETPMARTDRPRASRVRGEP
jgi:hypothetical protein